jgi:hypothetical protein
MFFIIGLSSGQPDGYRRTPTFLPRESVAVIDEIAALCKGASLFHRKH